MSIELLRLGLQFFAGETKEEEDEVIIPGEEGVTGASGVTGSTTPAYKMPENTVSKPVAQDFDTWYKANGGMDESGYYAKYDLDPDRDYQNTVNTLNYDYQTSMATYGEQAEKMYQMGLQNSGVSDIFQANAFSSYLGNMNQAAADRITARKRNKAAFNDYVANMRAQHGQYETGIKTEYDTKLNSAFAFALDRYNGYNLDSVLSELGVAGYYTDIIEAVGDKLSGIDATSLAALQAQTENNLAQSILTAFPNLTEADRSAVQTMFGGMVPADALDAAFNRALTTYQNTDAGKTAAVNTFVTNWTDSFDPNEGKEAFVKKMITKEDGTLDESQRANAEAAWEQMNSTYNSTLSNTIVFIRNNIGEGKDHVTNELLRQGVRQSIIDAGFAEFLKTTTGNEWASGQDPLSVDELVAIYSAQFDPDYIGGMDAFIENVMGIDTSNGDSEAYKNAEAAWEEMHKVNKEQAMETLNKNILNAYGLIADLPASATDDDLKNAISMSGQTFNDAEIDGAIKRFRDINDLSEKIESGAIEDAVDAAVEDTETKFSEIGTDYTFKDINNAFAEVDSIEATYGKSDKTKSARNDYSSKGAELVEDFINGNKDINDTAAVKKYLEGFLSSDNLTNWDSLDDDGKRKAIVEAAVGASDKIGEASKKKIIDEYVNWKTKDIISFDENNAGETALADAGALVSYLKGLELGSEQTKKHIFDIISKLGIQYEVPSLTWSGEGEATLSISDTAGTLVTDESIKEKLNNQSQNNGGHSLQSLNGKIYMYGSVNEHRSAWREVSESDISVLYDWHTNSDEERKGIYNLLVVLLEMKQDSGYVQGELPSSTTVETGGDSTSGKKSNGKHGSGHSKDTYTAIK